MLSWSRRLVVALCLVFAVSSVAWAQAGDTPLRKNIDDLTAQELAAYEHAVQILKDRNQADPFDREGYYWQAWIHNCMRVFVPDQTASAEGFNPRICRFGQPPAGYSAANPGMCEHGKDIFLTWHRAQLFYFESLLRATDPEGLTGPSTKNVAIPYWNWTRAPSGVRYPTAFEDRTSPLFHEQRQHNKLTEAERRRLGQATNPALTAQLIYRGDWSLFGGFPQTHPTGGKGVFESAQHDAMHFWYFGPNSDMANPTTAALDPGFWSFHAYIDLVLEFWLQENGDGEMTSLDQFLRATQPKSVTPAPGHRDGAGVPSMGQSRIYLDLSELGYGYEVLPADALPSRQALTALLGAAATFGQSAQSPFALLAGDGFNQPELGAPTQIAQLPIAVTEDNRDAVVRFTRPGGAADVSFGVDFYFHPRDVTPDMDDQAFRQRYIYASRAYWGSGRTPDQMMMPPQKPLSLSMTDAIDSLLDGDAGSVWTLTAVVTGPDQDLSFGTLSLTAAR